MRLKVIGRALDCLMASLIITTGAPAPARSEAPGSNRTMTAIFAADQKAETPAGIN